LLVKQDLMCRCLRRASNIEVGRMRLLRLRQVSGGLWDAARREVDQMQVQKAEAVRREIRSAPSSMAAVSSNAVSKVESERVSSLAIRDPCRQWRRASTVYFEMHRLSKAKRRRTGLVV